MGKTISFAGNERMKANKIMPSSPIREAKGFKKLAIGSNKLKRLRAKMSAPIGADTAIALRRIFGVCSVIDEAITLKNSGLR